MEQFLIAAGIAAGAGLLAGGIAVRRWALCWALGHEVGQARTEQGVRDGVAALVRYSLCVRCQRRFAD